MKLNFSLTKSTQKQKKPCLRLHEFVNPAREWAIGLLGAAFVFALGATYIGIDLHEQFTKEPTYTDISESTLTYDKKGVVEYATQYREREAQFIKLRGERPAVIVPPPPVVPEVEHEPGVQPEETVPIDEIILQ